MDMGLRNMDLYLGMENKVVYNIMDVMSGICRIKTVSYTHLDVYKRQHLVISSQGILCSFGFL